MSLPFMRALIPIVHMENGFFQLRGWSGLFLKRVAGRLSRAILRRFVHLQSGGTSGSGSREGGYYFGHGMRGNLGADGNAVNMWRRIQITPFYTRGDYPPPPHRGARKESDNV